MQDLTKEDTEMAGKLWQEAPHHMSSGKCKLKQWDLPAYLLQRPKPRTLTTLQVGEEMVPIGTLTHGWWDARCNSHLGRQLVASYKVKHALTIWSGICTPMYITHITPNLCSHKICKEIFIIAFFITVKTWKQSRCSLVGEWMNKPLYIHTVE